MKYLTQVLAMVTAATAQQFDDTFDDLTSNVAAPLTSPVGAYHGLAYKGAVVLRPKTDLASLEPHSPAQFAGAFSASDLLQTGDLKLRSYVTITRDSTVRSFDFQSFYFGFGTDTATTVGVAQAGVLSVLAYDVNGKQLPVVTFPYAPNRATKADLLFAQLPVTFAFLQNVTLAVATSEPIAERTFIGIDDVRHFNHL
ncbi:hypothetical protein EG328_011394 [Venturia inaequalis]|uniref:Uncharacterized protein n=1 Tax=Venturia inaequalis TaxID=5025 RepID=A0A8H3V620_VENIN|nr:hypothetical protein EG328_011394 [Venturia inaequalis]